MMKKYTIYGEECKAEIVRDNGVIERPGMENYFFTIFLDRDWFAKGDILKIPMPWWKRLIYKIKYYYGYLVGKIRYWSKSLVR